MEYYSVLRALGAIRRADVSVIMVDAEVGLTEQDVKICGYVHEQNKPSVLVMNKWDLIEKDTHTIEKFNAKLQEDLKFMNYLVTLYVSAKTGQRTEKLLSLVEKVYDNARKRISTGQLNDLIYDAVRANEPPSVNGKRLKITYCTQSGVEPPTFLLFVNEAGLMHFSYKRYLENCIRNAYDFSGTPIYIQTREKDENEF